MEFLIIGLISLMFFIDLFVSLINYNYRNKPIPSNVKDIYEKEEYQKWLNYTMENVRLNIIEKSFNTLLIIALLVLGLFGFLQGWTSAKFASPILETLVFLGVFYVITTVVAIPFKYYSTFRIEEKYGFNKVTKKIFVIDIVKGIIVSSVLLGSIIAAFSLIFIEFANDIWLFSLVSWLFLSVVIIILFVLSAKIFVKIFNKLTPIEDGELKNRIKELSTKVGFSISAISVMDASKRSTKLNAFFSGLGKTREVVLFDTLIEKLSDDEILAVLAHELGHAMNKDAPKMLFQRIITFGVFAFVLGLIMQTPIVMTAFGLDGIHLGFGLILFMILIGPIDLIMRIPINYLSRKAEYAADQFSVKYVDKKHMMSALTVLVKENYANLNPHPLYVVLNYSHPPMALRLEAIEKCLEKNELV